MSVTETLIISPAETRSKDTTHNRKHARFEISDEPSKAPQPDHDGVKPEEGRKRKKKKANDIDAVDLGQEKDRKAKKRSRKENGELDIQTSEPQAEQVDGVEKLERSGREKSGEGMGTDAREFTAREEDSGESSERATEKELKRARKEAKRREKADRAVAKDAAGEGSVDQQAVDPADAVEEKRSKDKKKRKTETEDVVKNSKKRRTSVAQDLPNPEEDEELSEQARKGASLSPPH